jgi:hypothetical protein
MKTLLARAISKLEPDCTFSLLSNDGTGTSSLGTSIATAGNVAEALEWVGELSPVTEPDIFQAVCESGVPPYDECMTFVLFTRGAINSIYWETDRPTSTNIISALPEGSKFTSIKIPGVDHEFTAMFVQLCQELAESTGGRVIILE